MEEEGKNIRNENGLINYKEGKNIRNENGLINHKTLGRLFDFKVRDINDELVRKHFLVQDLGSLLKKLQRIRNNPEKDKIQLNLLNSGLRDLKEENEDMSEQEKETENPNEVKSCGNHS